MFQIDMFCFEKNGFGRITVIPVLCARQSFALHAICTCTVRLLRTGIKLPYFSSISRSGLI